MSPRFPPRREPRVLALVRTSNGFHYATADPWNLRAVGSVSCNAVSFGPAIARKVRQEKPTLILTRDDDLFVLAHRIARRFGLSASRERIPPLPAPIAADLYRDYRVQAPTPPFQRVASLAISAVLHVDVPPRKYAPTRHRPAQHPA